MKYGLMAVTSLTLAVAAAGSLFSLKITAYEQLNFFKVGSFSGEKKKNETKKTKQNTGTSCSG